MSEPKRFFDSCDDFERRLLRSVRNDAPAIGAASKTMVALGLNPAGVAATAAAGVAARAFGARAGSALTVLKGLGVGLLVGTVAIGVSGGLWQSSVRNARPVPDLLGGRRPSIVTGEPARPMSAEQPPAGSAITRPIARKSARSACC